MNKELILKYKAEFDHWLNEGSILVKYASPKQAEPGYTDWHEDELVWNSNLDYLIVINDSYVEFRKALAEGKTIQYNFSIPPTNSDKYPTYWQDLDPKIGILSDRAHPNQYRIKPEEPKFKVGDWVYFSKKENSRPMRIDKIDVDWVISDTNFTYKHYVAEYQLELWQPQPGEVCIFWRNTSTFAYIDEFSKPAGFVNGYTTRNSITVWDNCMPYIGELPPNLKD